MRGGGMGIIRGMNNSSAYVFDGNNPQQAPTSAHQQQPLNHFNGHSHTHLNRNLNQNNHRSHNNSQPASSSHPNFPQQNLNMNASQAGNSSQFHQLNGLSTYQQSPDSGNNYAAEHGGGQQRYGQPVEQQQQFAPAAMFYPQNMMNQQQQVRVIPYLLLDECHVHAEPNQPRVSTNDASRSCANATLPAATHAANTSVACTFSNAKWFQCATDAECAVPHGIQYRCSCVLLCHHLEQPHPHAPFRSTLSHQHSSSIWTSATTTAPATTLQATRHTRTSPTVSTWQGRFRWLNHVKSNATLCHHAESNATLCHCPQQQRILLLSVFLQTM